MESRDGVLIETEEFGRVFGVEHPAADPPVWWPNYFSTFVEYMESIGYTRDFDIRGAPYDFRLVASNDLKDIRPMPILYYFVAKSYLKYYFRNLTNEIETLHKHIHLRATMISHGMGCTLIQKFLETKSQVWKKKYIQKWIAINTPFAGSVGTLINHLFGDPLGRWNMGTRNEVKKIITTFPSLKFLHPSSSYFDKNKVLFNSNEGPYTLRNISEIFRKNDPVTFNLMNRLKIPDIWSNREIGVPFACVITLGMPTITKGIVQNFTTLIHFETNEKQFGDGTHTKDELKSCYHLVEKNNRFSGSIHVVRNADHNNILSTYRAMKILKDLIN